MNIKTLNLRELRVLSKRWLRLANIRDKDESRWQRVASALSEIDQEVKRRTTPKNK